MSDVPLILIVVGILVGFLFHPALGAALVLVGVVMVLWAWFRSHSR